MSGSSSKGLGLRKVLAYLRRYMGGFFDELGGFAVLLDVHSLSDEHRDEVLGRRKAVTNAVERLVKSGIKDGSIVPCDAKLAALFAFGVINWISVWYRPGGARTPEKSLDPSRPCSEMACNETHECVSSERGAGCPSRTDYPPADDNTSASPGLPHAVGRTERLSQLRLEHLAGSRQRQRLAAIFTLRRHLKFARFSRQNAKTPSGEISALAFG